MLQPHMAGAVFSVVCILCAGCYTQPVAHRPTLNYAAHPKANIFNSWLWCCGAILHVFPITMSGVFHQAATGTEDKAMTLDTRDNNEGGDQMQKTLHALALRGAAISEQWR